MTATLMGPERWRLISKIFHGAAVLPPSERQAFLEQECGTDVEVRREVEKLLTFDDDSDVAPELIIAREAASFGQQTEVELIGSSLGPYRIIREIGSGGMGAVFLAEDARLQRSVALKLLPQYFASDSNRLRRFQLEARTASAINHPNVITIHEVEQIDGRYFIVSEYVEGPTLAERIGGKPLPLSEAIGIALQITDGLAEAHRLGIIHRDIKPRNIMITDRGIVKILDFGLAKISQSDRTDSTSGNTASGMIVGTVSYMSPEQARAQELDARTDLFSFGLLLYEMITGRQAFSGASDALILEAILNKDPTPATSLNSEVPPELSRIISKALEKDRETRYQSAAEIRADLRRLQRDTESGAAPKQPANFIERTQWLRTPIIALVLILMIASTLFYRISKDSQPIRSLAVLPFVNVSGDSNAEYLSDGITDNIINTLSQIADLKVMARGSVFSLKGSEIDPREAGRKLKVDAVVTGRVLQQGETLIIRAEMMDMKDGSQLWGNQYDRTFSDILQTQREIAQEISEKLRIRLNGEEKDRLTKSYKTNTESYRLCLLGEYYARKENQESFKKSVEYYLQAIQADPNYALAYSGLAHAYINYPAFEVAPFREVAPKVLEAATRALALDDTLAQPHVSLGNYYRNKSDFKNAEKEYKRAIELKPDYSEAYVFLALLHSLLGHNEEAVEESKRALELDPLWVSNYAFDGLVLTAAGQFTRAAEQLQKAKDLEPSFCVTYVNRGQLYRVQGEMEEAIQELKSPQSQAIECSGTWGKSELAYTYAIAGRREEAIALLNEILQYSKQRFVSTNYIAIIYLGLEDKQQALFWLEKGFREESFWTGDMIPYLPILRTDPLFAGFLQKSNLH